MNKFVATKNDAGRTILKFITSVFKNVPHHKIEKLFRKKNVKINEQKISDKKIILKENDVIKIYGLNLEVKNDFKDVEIHFEVVYEDENILVVNKPENFVVHGKYNSIDNQVLSYLKFKKVDSFTPSHVGRLDKLTSGIMLYAKNYNSLKELNNKKNYFEKFYTAISNLNEKVLLEAFIFHDDSKQKEFISQKKGKKCKTSFTPINDNKLLIQTFSGRKHQIRASLEYLKFPIKGDVKYGATSAKRLYLHSSKLILNNLQGHLSYLNKKEFISEPNF